MNRIGIAGFTLWLFIAATPAGAYLEASLLSHVLIEIPLLIVIGMIAGALLKQHLTGVLDVISIPGILLACFTLAFWMIPRWLDASVNDEFIASMKYLSLPALAGAPLALCWRNLHPVARGVVKIELLAMLLRLGWLYLVSPDRLCNNYLLSEQQELGYAFIVLASAAGIIWLYQAFFGRQQIALQQAR